MVVTPMPTPQLTILDQVAGGAPISFGTNLLTGGGKRRRKRTNKKKRTTKRKMRRSRGRRIRSTIKYSSKKRNTLMNLRAKLKKLY